MNEGHIFHFEFLMLIVLIAVILLVGVFGIIRSKGQHDDEGLLQILKKLYARDKY